MHQKLMSDLSTLPKKYANERVLVVPRESIDSTVKHQGVAPVTEQLLQLFSHARTMRRDDAEKTVEFTQLVAYFIVVDGVNVLTHRRSKRQPEKRLTDVRSIGFSGHMTDTDLQSLSSYDLFHGSGQSGYANRELAEEVKVKVSSSDPISMRCCIWDPFDDLGKQHIGLVYEVPTAGHFEVLEPGLITDACFETMDAIRSNINAYTSWSQLLAGSTAGDDLLAKWRNT